MSALKLVYERAVAGTRRPQPRDEENPTKLMECCQSCWDTQREKVMGKRLSEVNRSQLALIMASSVLVRDAVGVDVYGPFDRAVSRASDKLTEIQCRTASPGSGKVQIQLASMVAAISRRVSAGLI